MKIIAAAGLSNSYDRIFMRIFVLVQDVNYGIL